MKKKILAIAMFVALGLSANAQSDGFFSGGYSEYREDSWAQNMPILPGQHGTEYDFTAEAPLGSGLLLLGGMALAYGMRKKD